MSVSLLSGAQKLERDGQGRDSRQGVTDTHFRSEAKVDELWCKGSLLRCNAIIAERDHSHCYARSEPIDGSDRRLRALVERRGEHLIRAEGFAEVESLHRFAHVRLNLADVSGVTARAERLSS